MRLLELSLRDFRSYAAERVPFADGITVILGPNGAGKTNLLEALYFGCTGRSCRTSNEREVLRFGAEAARVEVEVEAEDGRHQLSVGFTPGQPKRLRVDGAPVERLLDSPHRPLLSVFLPERLELVKGTPAVRRAHLDQFVAALWPARAATRRAYAQVLAQRNALLARIRAGHSRPEQLDQWDLQLAREGMALMKDRAAAAEQLAAPFAGLAEALGLAPNDAAAVIYRPRSTATSVAELAEELASRHRSDLDRGFTGHGPHRDDLALLREGRELRAYGSQGQQRLGLLALLLAERRMLAAARADVPLMLLDDVLSELDRARRRDLLDLLLEDGGQSIITTTDLEQLPPAAPVVSLLAVEDGCVRVGATAQ